MKTTTARDHMLQKRGMALRQTHLPTSVWCEGRWYNYSSVVLQMDKSIVRVLNSFDWLDSQSFFDAYRTEHQKKYKVVFIPSVVSN